MILEPHSPLITAFLPPLPPSPQQTPISLPVMAAQAATIAALAGLSADQLALVIATALTTPAAAPATPRIKISPPERFKYERSYNVYTFIFACEAVFDNQNITDEWTRVRYAVSYMDGAPIMWARGFIQKLPAAMRAAYTWAQFKVDLTGIYGDPDRRLRAAGDLRRLQQRKSAAEYASEFSSLAQLTSWDDQALTDQFYNGLKQEVRVEIARGAFPASLTDLIHEAIRIDGRLFEGRRRNPQAGGSRPTYQPRPQIHRRDPNAMDVDATTRLGRLTPELRAQLLREGKCFRCRKTGHMSRECKGPASVAAVHSVAATNYRFNPDTGEANPHYREPAIPAAEEDADF